MPVDIGLDLTPEWVSRAAPETRICSMLAPISRINSRLVAHRIRRPFEDAPDQVRSAMRTVRPIQAPLASGSKCGVRSPVR